MLLTKHWVKHFANVSLPEAGEAGINCIDKATQPREMNLVDQGHFNLNKTKPWSQPSVGWLSTLALGTLTAELNSIINIYKSNDSHVSLRLYPTLHV